MKDFKSQDTWMVFKIMGEFVDGFETLRRLGPAVSIFGGARFKEGSAEYQLAEEIAAKVAKAGYAIITGGGPGVMEAANKGAKSVGAKSVGLNIKLPFEQGPNPFANVKIDFDYFFARKVMFIRYAQAYICLPGGYGTLDEATEALTLIQTAKIRNFPVILVGRAFWKGFIDWIEDTLLKAATIGPEDTKIYSIADTAEEVLEIIHKSRDRARRLARGGRGVSTTEIQPRQDTGPRERTNGDEKISPAVAAVVEKAVDRAMAKAAQSAKKVPTASSVHGNVRRPRGRRRRA